MLVPWMQPKPEWVECGFLLARLSLCRFILIKRTASKTLAFGEPLFLRRFKRPSFHLLTLKETFPTAIWNCVELWHMTTFSRQLCLSRISRHAIYLTIHLLSPGARKEARQLLALPRTCFRSLPFTSAIFATNPSCITFPELLILWQTIVAAYGI